ncbi:error-prone DNA polymerase [Salinisphaera sp. Q1T1-3]|uniref:error-prone DNA polymerase n=1 Tax=Salinisphaera sp. Q1T1-3 TaxID=2321229 RepID=UPI000E708E89|nr:error-prone DNA polymerase [Salinisphaera sp. Q1T1-3]RJS95075.1 error-prone DNA polymerase [Salinisphaera sp. Q1T1-3]
MSGYRKDDQSHDVYYAELCCVSNFSFHFGASHPEEMIERAARLGYDAIALTDECSLAGAVRALTASEQHGIKLILGTRITLVEGPTVVVLARNRAGYTQLCRLITRGRNCLHKGQYRLARADLNELGAHDCWLVVLPDYARAPEPALHDLLGWLSVERPHAGCLALALHRGPHDALHVERLYTLGSRHGLPVVAVGDACMHARSRLMLQNVFTALRLHTTVQAAGQRLAANGERYLRARHTLAAIYPAETLARTRRIVDGCHFNLRDIRYDYPHEAIPPGMTSSQFLRAEVEKGAVTRWPSGISHRVRQRIEDELSVIEELGYPHYFLTVYDIVREARRRAILCQGRGSAANSAVCFCLGITDVDPARHELLFERFISRERNEPPDIDVDFEHARREEIIQHIYAKYGRHRAALAATVIRYRPRSAMRDVGRAMGLSADQIDVVASELSQRADDGSLAEQLAARGVPLDADLLPRILSLVDTLLGFPRHLSQHVGGFVLSQPPLAELVPVEKAAMAERTIIQWDKDDLEAVGLMKIDVLALGMLSCIRRCFDLIQGYTGRLLSMAGIPGRDPSTYAMIQAADTIGVFQIESRAQMTMLPRLRPEKFFDLVVEVAIVRPGPIQGGMVHPYLAARQKTPDQIVYPSEALRGVLERTLGVPIFQEQVMKIAIVAAGFTGDEANGLRKSMAAWKKQGGLEPWRDRLKRGMAERGYDDAFAERIFEQIKGFGSYGFPESHAVSFALLVYVSAYLKCHYPAAFTAALLNSQPMGFYAPAQLVRDARRHGVTVRPPDVRYAAVECTLESVPGAPATRQTRPALRLGLNRVKGLSPVSAERIVAARAAGAFTSIADLVQRARLDHRARNALARADALIGLAGHRHAAQWQIAATEVQNDLFADIEPPPEPAVTLPEPTEATGIMADYHSTGLTLRRHPLALIRRDLAALGAMTAAVFNRLHHGAHAEVAGIATMRQRPGSAKGVTFVTLEDETGTINIIVRREVLARFRVIVLSARLMRVRGIMQRAGTVMHCLAHEIIDETNRLGQLQTRSRDFR